MKLSQIFIISFLLLVNFISSAYCKDITLSWDPSPTPEVSGYMVYYKQGNSNLPFDGTDATEGASPIDVGDTLTTTLTGLDETATYYFSVTAYDYSNNQSSYSNIVSNADGDSLISDTDTPATTWAPALIRPANNATGEPIPVTFQWETAPTNYDVTYTLFYGTNEDELTNAGAIIAVQPTSGTPNVPAGVIIALTALLLVTAGSHLLPKIKTKLQTTSLVAIILLGGILTACGGGGGGSDSSGDHSVATVDPPTATLYAVTMNNSDYYEGYDLEPGTTYYWKVVATDAQDTNIVYTSEVRQFTTDSY